MINSYFVICETITNDNFIYKKSTQSKSLHASTRVKFQDKLVVDMSPSLSDALMESNCQTSQTPPPPSNDANQSSQQSPPQVSSYHWNCVLLFNN